MNKKILLCVMAALIAVSATTLYAGGPLYIYDAATQTPYAYPVGTVSVYTDLGDNGVFTNAQSDAMTAFGYAEWTAVPSSYLSAAVVGDFSAVGLPDIDGFNAGMVIGTFNGGGIHVMYDDDSSIVSFYFGAPPGVLGISSPDFATGSVIDESWAVINGSAADPGDTGSTYQGVFTHEFGHSINLAHTQCTGAAGFFGDNRGPDACATPYPTGITLDDFETMYPYLDITPGSTGDYQATVDHADDIAAISTIYPTAGFPGTHGTISGVVYGPDGITQLTGINVIARPLSNPFKGAVTALSGDFTQGDLGPDGRFTLNGLTPGEDYVVYIDEIVAGGFSTTPGTITGDGDEEYWNASESADPNVDDPCDYTVITAAAGVTATADIIVNGNPNALDLDDDDYVEVALPFSFPFCGNSYNSVFVGSNGYLTFGSGDTDYTESVSEFLNDQPRIAGWWDDLSPNQGGSITAMPDGADFVVSYNGVPQFLAGDDNTFEIRLRADGSYDVTYESLNSTDGIAGRSAGGGVPDPGSIDLSTAAQPIGAGMATVYEYFPFGTGDLANTFLAFGACVIPDPPMITVDPTSLSAFLAQDDMVTQTLTICNVGDLDLSFVALTNQDLGAPATGSIPVADLGGTANPIVLDDSRLDKMATDVAASSGTKPEVIDQVPLPHMFALPLVVEDFNSGFPAGWTAIDNEGNGIIWSVPQQGTGNHTGGTGDACGANSDAVGTAEYDTELWMPAVTNFGPNVVLSFVANYQNFAAFDYFDVDVSVDGGTNWTNVMRWNEDHGGFFGPPGEQVALDLDPYVQGFTEFIVRFHWYDPLSGDWDWYVQIDDVMLVSDEVLTPCAYLSVVPDNATLAGDECIDLDVTFDATGFAPGVYPCEIIISSNAVNEPRIVVPVEMTVAWNAAMDIRPGDCPNPMNVKYTLPGFEMPGNGYSDSKGGWLKVAIAGGTGFDVGDIDLSTIYLESTPPRARKNGSVFAEYGDEIAPFYPDNCSCGETGPDSHQDLSVKFSNVELGANLDPGTKGEVRELTLTAQLVDGSWLIAKDCIKFVGNDGQSNHDGDDVDIAQQSVTTGLGTATPNPFNPITRISYSLKDAGEVRLFVYDVRGRLVKELVNGVRTSGLHTVEWNATGVASGIYFYRLQTANYSETRKMILLK